VFRPDHINRWGRSTNSIGSLEKIY